MSTIFSDRGADRRRAILDLAEQHFARFGYHGAALSAIAREAGLRNPSLLHHFPSKSKLYLAVLEDIATDLEARTAAALSGPQRPGARLSAFIAANVAWMRARPHAFRVIQRELLDNSERVAQAQILPLSRFVRALEALIVEAQHAGEVAAGPPAAKLSLVLGALAYAQAVRPTLAQMFATALLCDETTWMAAAVREVEMALGLVRRRR